MVWIWFWQKRGVGVVWRCGVGRALGSTVRCRRCRREQERSLTLVVRSRQIAVGVSADSFSKRSVWFWLLIVELLCNNTPGASVLFYRTYRSGKYLLRQLLLFITICLPVSLLLQLYGCNFAQRLLILLLHTLFIYYYGLFHKDTDFHNDIIYWGFTKCKIIDSLFTSDFLVDKNIGGKRESHCLRLN